jgi:siroheme synthase
MVTSNVCTIADEIIPKGWPPDTPVLPVYNVKGTDQQENLTTLQNSINNPFQI